MVDWGEELFHAAIPIEQLDEGRPRRKIPEGCQPWYNAGKDNQKVAFVFACPGRAEMDWQMPVAGETGLTLNMLLAFLKIGKPELFPDLDRYEYRIVNASSAPRYEALGEKTTPTNEEIRNQAQRVRSELSGANIVLCMGDDAWKSCGEAYGFVQPQSEKASQCKLKCSSLTKDDILFIKCMHLSLKAINRISRRIDESSGGSVPDWVVPEKSENRSKYRVMIIAKAICDTLEAAEYQRQQGSGSRQSAHAGASL